MNVGKKETRHEKNRMRRNGYDDVDVHVLHAHALPCLDFRCAAFRNMIYG